MNTYSKSIRVRAAVLALAGLASAHAGMSRAEGMSLDDELLQEAGEFQLGNGDSRTIADAKTPEPYRVCVAKGPDSVPVTAQYDDQERTIGVGDCADLTAKRIRLQPAAHLNEDEILIGKYEHRR